MKKIIIFLLLFSSVSLLASKQRQEGTDISGVYHHPSGAFIKIENNRFYFIVPQTGTPVWYSDTLAICTFEWVGNNFIELNSTPPHIIAQEGFNITQTLDTTIPKDSIKISFIIPFRRGGLDIEIWTNRFDVFNLDYTKSNTGLMLPNHSPIRTIMFAISPQQHVSSFGSCGQFHGILSFAPMESFVIERNINHISIEIPAINGSFFERYFVRGQYAKVSRNTITWKGEVFTKRQR